MKLFIANWKMHKTRPEARAFVEALSREIESRAPSGEIVIAPSLTLLDSVADPGGRCALGCQNVAAEREGAHTGEVAAAQCFDAGCRWAIVGHSERRRDF